MPSVMPPAERSRVSPATARPALRCHEATDHRSAPANDIPANDQHFSKSKRGLRFGLYLVPLALACFDPTALHAQLWYRDSMIAPTSAATFEQEQPRGVLKLGPVVVDLSAQTFVDYSNNEFLTPAGQSGSHLGAGATIDVTWQAAKAQRLKLAVNFSRRQTLSGPTKSRSFFAINPGSALLYTVYVGDLRITPFINLSRQDNPLLASTVNNTDSYRQATYDAGIQADWQLHKGTIQTMVLRGLRTADTDGQAQQETDRVVGSLRVTRSLNPTFDVGADFFAVAQDYRNGPAKQSTTQAASIFARFSFSKAIQLKGAIGLIKTALAQSRLRDDSPGETSLFNQLEMSHRVRQNVNYALRYSQTIDDGVSTNFIRTRQFSFSPALTLSDRLALRLEADWQRVIESARSGEAATRWSYLGKIEWTSPKDFVLRLTLRDINKTSSLASRAYAQRYVEINLSKQF